MPRHKRTYAPRPYYIWDAVKKVALPRRSYANQETAAEKALILASQMKVGTRLEVIRTWGHKMICQVSRHADGILRFWR